MDLEPLLQRIKKIWLMLLWLLSGIGMHCINLLLNTLVTIMHISLPLVFQCDYGAFQLCRSVKEERFEAKMIWLQLCILWFFLTICREKIRIHIWVRTSQAVHANAYNLCLFWFGILYLIRNNWSAYMCNVYFMGYYVMAMQWNIIQR